MISLTPTPIRGRREAVVPAAAEGPTNLHDLEPAAALDLLQHVCDGARLVLDAALARRRRRHEQRALAELLQQAACVRLSRPPLKQAATSPGRARGDAAQRRARPRRGRSRARCRCRRRGLERRRPGRRTCAARTRARPAQSAPAARPGTGAAAPSASAGRSARPATRAPARTRAEIDRRRGTSSANDVRRYSAVARFDGPAERRDLPRRSWARAMRMRCVTGPRSPAPPRRTRAATRSSGSRRDAAATSRPPRRVRSVARARRSPAARAHELSATRPAHVRAADTRRVERAPRAPPARRRGPPGAPPSASSSSDLGPTTGRFLDVRAVEQRSPGSPRATPSAPNPARAGSAPAAVGPRPDRSVPSGRRSSGTIAETRSTSSRRPWARRKSAVPPAAPPSHNGPRVTRRGQARRRARGDAGRPPRGNAESSRGGVARRDSTSRCPRSSPPCRSSIGTSRSAGCAQRPVPGTHPSGPVDESAGSIERQAAAVEPELARPPRTPRPAAEVLYQSLAGRPRGR